MAFRVALAPEVGLDPAELAAALYDFLKQKFGRETAVQVVERPDQPPIIVVVLVEAD